MIYEIEGILMKRKKTNNSKFESFVQGKIIPLLTLDKKWHDLFPQETKTPAIKKAEAELNKLIQQQGQLNNELKEYSALKNNIMKDIVDNMEAATSNDSSLVKKQIKNQKYILDINKKLEEHNARLENLPDEIEQANENLMMVCMEYLYGKLKENDEQITALTEWIREIRPKLTESLIERDELQTYNATMYGYMHDLFGAEITSIFDIKYKAFQPEEEFKKGAFTNAVSSKR